jgi:GNAT superfamily N-acetyltransferase
VTATVRALTAEETAARLDALVEILCDVVDGGGSVNFLAPMDRGLARSFWQGVVPAVESGDRVLFVAEDAAGPVGTVQLEIIRKPNQPHRCEVAKLLVHRRARRQGIARKLMQALEAEARRQGRTLLTMDTVRGSGAEVLYRGLGFQAAGVIPRYALGTTGALEDTVVMFKELG